MRRHRWGFSAINSRKIIPPPINSEKTWRSRAPNKNKTAHATIISQNAVP
jgi:hypothetical protein